MRFHLIDRVEEFLPGKQLRGFKNLTMGRSTWPSISRRSR